MLESLYSQVYSPTLIHYRHGENVAMVYTTLSKV